MVKKSREEIFGEGMDFERLRSVVGKTLLEVMDKWTVSKTRRNRRIEKLTPNAHLHYQYPTLLELAHEYDKEEDIQHIIEGYTKYFPKQAQKAIENISR